MPVKITGAVATDRDIANALQPPTRGVSSPGSVTIPGNWLTTCLAGTAVPGCTSHVLEGSTMQVTPTVQTLVKNNALVLSLGFTQPQIDAFKSRIAAGTYVASPFGGERVPTGLPRKNGIAWVSFFDDAGNPTNIGWTVPQAQAALNYSNPAWWHNFMVSPQGLTSPSGTKFVPMLLEAADYTPSRIATAVANAEAGWILGQGEPDGHGYSVAQVVANWHTLVNDSSILANPQIKLVSPYPQGDQSGAGSFLRQVESGIVANGDRMWDAIALDRYAAASTILQIIANYHAVWPTTELWIPEYAIDSGFGGGGATQAQFVDFMFTMAEAIDRDSLVSHHAIWYSGPQSWPGNNYALRAMHDNSAQPTPLAPAWRGCGSGLPI